MRCSPPAPAPAPAPAAAAAPAPAPAPAAAPAPPSAPAPAPPPPPSPQGFHIAEHHQLAVPVLSVRYVAAARRHVVDHSLVPGAIFAELGHHLLALFVASFLGCCELLLGVDELRARARVNALALSGGGRGLRGRTSLLICRCTGTGIRGSWVPWYDRLLLRSDLVNSPMVLHEQRRSAVRERGATVRGLWGRELTWPGLFAPRSAPPCPRHTAGTTTTGSSARRRDAGTGTRPPECTASPCA